MKVLVGFVLGYMTGTLIFLTLMQQAPTQTTQVCDDVVLYEDGSRRCENMVGEDAIVTKGEL